MTGWGAELREELVTRLSLKREKALGGLSAAAYEELVRAVRDDPASFVCDDAEAAFSSVADAVATFEAMSKDEEFLSDDEYARLLEERLAALRGACERALAVDPGCADAELLRILGAPMDAVDRVAELRALDKRLAEACPLAAPATGDCWDDVFLRPSLRVRAALARMAGEAACYRMARDLSLAMIDLAPSDVLGLRFTAALALARLEDEKGFDDLDARFGRRGNAWSNLSRAVMLFKLDRMAAARRALNGYRRLNKGAAYALLRPSYVEPYLPCRPQAEPGSYQEAVLAVHEADPVIVDAPDFIDWCTEQPGVVEEASAFAQEMGFDW